MEHYIIYKTIAGKKYIIHTSKSKDFAVAQEGLELGYIYCHWNCRLSGFPVPSPSETEEWIDTRTSEKKRRNAFSMETDEKKIEALEDMRENGTPGNVAHAPLIALKQAIRLRYP